MGMVVVVASNHSPHDWKIIRKGLDEFAQVRAAILSQPPNWELFGLGLV